MGLMDMIKRRAMNAVANAVGDAVEDVVEGALDQVIPSKKGQSSSSRNVSRSANKENAKESGEKLLRSRLEQIIEEEWSGYELRKNVPASEMNAESGARTYSYGIYQDGIPKAMIMILDDRNLYKKREVLLSQRACGQMRVAYMNFMTYLPNREDYISKRLQENIR
nr:hypothetical protein [Lachnospiraceae bacterium]